MKALIIDNFFDDHYHTYNEIKKLKFYSLKEFNSKFNQKQTWPGTRTEILPLVNLKLSENIVHQFFKKAKGFLDTSKVNIEMYAHQRDKKFSKKDWIHNDLCVGDYTCLIYLSKTNLKSGTKFYSDTKKVIHDVSFVQNRAIIFDSRYLHSAYGHHDGRLNVLLTINK